MDIKQNNKGKTMPQSNASDNQSYYTESNTGHISVQSVSPFRMRGSELGKESILKCKTDRSSNIFGKKNKLPKDACSSATSKLLVKQIISENNHLDGDGVLKEGLVDKTAYAQHRIENKCNYNQSFLINDVEFKHSAPTLYSKHSSMRLGLTSREESIAPALNAQCTRSERRIYTSHSVYSTQSVEQKQYAEKTTYCRPVLSFNKEFLNKTRERNLRLQQLVKKLVLARQREKETEAVNNYINELKTRHGTGHCENELNFIPKTYECRRVDLIDHMYKSTFNRSQPCNDMLREFYGVCEKGLVSGSSSTPSRDYCQTKYDNTYECYPMSSQGRLIMLKNERAKNTYAHDRQFRTPNRYYYDTIVVEKQNYRSKRVTKASESSTLRSKSLASNEAECGTVSRETVYEEPYKDFATQTCIEENFEKRGEPFVRESLQEQYSRVSQNVDRLKKRIQDTVQRDGTSVLRSIENKLDTLMSSLNTFIRDVRSNTTAEQCFNCNSLNANKHSFNFHNMNSPKRETCGLTKAERLMCNHLTANATNPIPFTTFQRETAEKPCSTDNKTVTDVGSNVESKDDIENGKSLKPCSVHISLDIPTRDLSTEVSDSLSKSLLHYQDKSVTVHDVSRNGSGECGRMAIAVNTDPLGLLALLRISAEALKQYMPNFPYNLQMIQFLQTKQLPQPRQNAHFVCNICGAAFERPSQLSDHIQGHDLGRTRDCCVCRHILDMQSQQPVGLFRCQYCGQRFTRAYCCELHQESCAKRFGLQHDITPSLMLLR